MATIYKRIKELRKERGLTQTELAELVGYKDKSAIAKIEAGNVDIPNSKIETFARVLRVDYAYLIGASDDHNASSVVDFLSKNSDFPQQTIEIIKKTRKMDKSQLERLSAYIDGMMEK